MKRIVATDGASISLSKFDDLGIDRQQDWLDDHGIPLSHSGDSCRLASGIPGTYNHLSQWCPWME